MHDILDKALNAYEERSALAETMKPVANSIRIESKFAISLIRRDKRNEASAALEKAEEQLKILEEVSAKSPHLSRLGFYHEALEEYVEAKVYVSLLTGGKLIWPANISIEPAVLIGGIADATGELVRRAITVADVGTLDEIAGFQHIAEEVANKLSNVKMDAKIRKKYDDVERNVRRLEEILYDVRMKKK